MRINNNISALTAFNSLTRNTNHLQDSIRQLSTGLRINSASDDAAGLAISEAMRSQINGLNRAVQNAQDGISLLQTAEGALGETNSMLQRMRELAVQGANDTLTSQDRNYIQMEIDALKAQIDRIADTTQFNKKRLLDGSSCGVCTSTDTSTKGYIRGAINVEGNYRIDVRTNPGQAQVQKSSIFKVKHENTVTNAQLASDKGIENVKIDNLPAGDYTITASMGAGGEVTNIYEAKLDGTVNEANTSGANEVMTLTFTSESGKTAKIEGIKISSDCNDEEKFASAVVNAVNQQRTIEIEGQTITLRASLNPDKKSYTIYANGSTPDGHITGMSSEISLEPLAKVTEENNQEPSKWYTINDVQQGGSEGDGGYSFELNGTTYSVPPSGRFAINAPAQTIANSIRDVAVSAGLTNAFVAGSTVYLAPQSSGPLNYRLTGASLPGGWHVPRQGERDTYSIDGTITLPVGNDNPSNKDNKAIFTVRLGSTVIATYDDITPGTSKEDIVAEIGNKLGSSFTYPPNAAAGSRTINLEFTDNGEGSFSIKSKDPDLDIWTSTLNLSASFEVKTEKKGDTQAVEDTSDPYPIITPIPETDGVATLTGTYGINADEAFDISLEGASGKVQNNASILFEVTSKSYDSDTNAGVITLSAMSNVMEVDGTTSTHSLGKITLSTYSPSVNLGSLLGEDDDHFQLSFKQDDDGNVTFDVSQFEAGQKFVYNICGVGDPNGVLADTSFFVNGKQDSSWPYSWGDYMTHDNNSAQYNINAEQASNKELKFRQFYLNSDNGQVYDSEINLTVKDDFKDAAANFTGNKVHIASFTSNYVGKIADADTKLRDLEQFWDKSGVFMLTQPQTITISQKDGKRASITLNASDTLNDVRRKLNDAIANDLDQGRYVKGGNANNIVTYVETASSGGMESVKGTFLIRSLIPGSAGELTFTSDNGDLIDSLGLNTVQEAKGGSYTVSVYNAHDNIAIARNIKTSGNMLEGVIDKNIDVEFDPMAGVNAVWSDTDKNFILTPESETYSTTLHIVKNNIAFQTGAGEGEEISLDIGDMSARALGLDSVNVTSHDRASKSITILDRAIRQLSSQRSKIGAYQNALEHTIENLTVTNANLTAAESRIRDADMSKSMLELVKFQIINQTSTSMLAQANQMPQSVLNLLQ